MKATLPVVSSGIALAMSCMALPSRFKSSDLVDENVGAAVGTNVGTDEGTAVGTSFGFAVGTSVGTAVGASVGTSVGSSVGSTVGAENDVDIVTYEQEFSASVLVMIMRRVSNYRTTSTDT